MKITKITKGTKSAEGVKIVAASDIHGACLQRIGDEVIRYNPDIFVIAGDLQGGGRSIDGRAYYEREFIPMVRRLRSYDIEVVLVPGNHDIWLYNMDTKKLAIPRGYHLLIDNEETVCGLKFYGTPWCPFINGRWVYESEEDRLEYVFSKIPENLDVLIAHSPPLGMEKENMDVSMQFKIKFRQHFGSPNLRREIVEKRPRLVLCGHIHSGDHRPYVIGRSTVANVSLMNEEYYRAYGMARVTFTGDGIKYIKGKRI